MAEYVSMVENNNYEIRFKTQNYDEYKEIEDAVRAVIGSSYQKIEPSKTKCCTNCVYYYIIGESRMPTPRCRYFGTAVARDRLCNQYKKKE